MAAPAPPSAPLPEGTSPASVAGATPGSPSTTDGASSADAPPSDVVSGSTSIGTASGSDLDVGAAAADASDATDGTPSLAAERHDLDDLLARLHEDMDLEISAAPTNDELTDPRQFERSQMPDRDEIVVESTGGLDFRPAPAGVSRRLVGFLLDQIVVAVALAPGVAVAIIGSGGAPIALGVVVAIVGFVAAAAWYGRAVSSSGRWVGNRIVGTRVVDVRNGSTVATGHAFTRFVVRELGAVFVIPAAMALTDPQRRTFHDRLAGTVVIGRARETWTVDDEPGPLPAPR